MKEPVYAIRPTTDPVEVLAILRHPKIWKHVHEDGHEHDYLPDFGKRVSLLCELDGQAVGLVQFAPMTGGKWEGHYSFTPAGYGHAAQQLARMAIMFAFMELGASRLVGFQPVFNRLGLHFSANLGFTLQEVIPVQYRKHGKLWDVAVWIMDRTPQMETPEARAAFQTILTARTPYVHPVAHVGAGNA